jgi:hypothetical protein
MNAELLTDVVRLVLPPAVGAAVATTIGGILKRAARRTPAQAGAAGTLKLSGGSSTTWPAPKTTAEAATRPQRLLRAADYVWKAIDRLPPLKRRASTWKATLLGSVLVGFGIAAYFRTAADVLVGLALTLPLLVGVSLSPEARDDSQVDPTGPAWLSAVTYTTMALTGLYAYLRTVSSNRRLDAASPSLLERRSAEERKVALAREVQLRAAEGWRVESAGDFEAVISRVRRPNHVLHLVVTLLTLFWGFVWIAVTLAARSRHEREYRRAFVDEFGNRSVDPLPAPEGTTSLAP